MSKAVCNEFDTTNTGALGNPEIGANSKSRMTRIALKQKARIRFVEVEALLAVRAECNYVSLQCASRSYRLRGSLSEMEHALRSLGFIRIHRSILVNRSWVEEVWGRTAGDCGLRLKDGKELKVTRTYKKNLKSLAELWFSDTRFEA